MPRRAVGRSPLDLPLRIFEATRRQGTHFMGALRIVAPVAGGVPDREQDRHVPPPRLGECRVRPRLPVDGVGRVLE